MITEQKYREVAKELGIEVAVIKAVAEVESRGNGFMTNGEPTILFEPHVFWRVLKAKGIDPNKYTKGNTDILYPKFKTGHYGKTSEQHGRLQRAVKIDRDSALMAASWGKFQVLGENYKSLGYKTIQEFINDAYRNEDSHLDMFVRYVKVNNLVRYLKTKDWESFSRGYNGKSYAVNKYPQKLKAAYARHNAA